jgi:ADP-ribose pyrophosphatase YjhB (NUDIX family)
MTQQDLSGHGLYDSLGRPLDKLPDKIHPATNTVLINEANQVLLQRRADNGSWALPGGAVEIAETVEQGAIRETFEETGLHVAVKRLVGVYSDPKDYAILRYPDGYTVHYIVTLFEVERVGGELQISDESTDLRFFDVDKLPEDIAPSARIRINDTLQGRREAFYK